MKTYMKKNLTALFLFTSLLTINTVCGEEEVPRRLKVLDVKPAEQREWVNHVIPLPHEISIDKKAVPAEIMKLEDAIIRTRKQILKIQQEIAKEMDREHAEIFDAHLMVIEDRTLIEEIIRRTKKEHLNVEYIFSDVLKKYTAAFSKIDDEYLRERVADIHDVTRRVIRNLT